jgi:hypothetical protein
MRVIVYLFGCVEMDWGALAPGDVELSLEIFFYPPPLKSQVKSVMEGWFPQTFWERVWGNFLRILEDCVKGFVLNLIGVLHEISGLF